MEDFIKLFIDSETPFAILFVVLFIFYVRESKSREERQVAKYDSLQNEVENQIGEVQKDLKIMLSIWKILIENEIERRKQ